MMYQNFFYLKQNCYIRFLIIRLEVSFLLQGVTSIHLVGYFMVVPFPISSYVHTTAFSPSFVLFQVVKDVAALSTYSVYLLSYPMLIGVLVHDMMGALDPLIIALIEEVTKFGIASRMGWINIIYNMAV